MTRWHLPALGLALLGTFAAVVVAAVADPGVSSYPTQPSVTQTSAPSSAVTPTSSVPPEESMRHTQVSGTAYTRANLLTTARETIANPREPLGPLAAEAPGIGPIGTQLGQDDCFSGAVPAMTTVELVDLALYEGQPAAVVVGLVDGERVVAVVRRYCQGTDADVLHPATPLPQS